MIKCPECEKQISEHASFCPNCGFGVKEYVDKQREEQAAFEEFIKNHQDFTTTDDGWFKLFSVYEYMVDRVAKTTLQLGKYRNIWFNDGVPSYPIDFCNGWFGCIADTYIEIIKKINAVFSDFPDAQIKENIKELASYKHLPAMRAVLVRWNDLVMDPFKKNSPAVLKQADNRYAAEVAQKSAMGFGIITNSVASMALYAVQASMKEVEAKNEAEKNRQAYVNNAMTNLQRNVTVAWDRHYNEFMDDVELCHKLVFFEISNIVFKGYLFNWQMVDSEFVKPSQNEAYQLRKKAIEEEATHIKKEKSAALSAKREIYIADKSKLLDALDAEIASITTEIEQLGLALFGEKARRKKALQAELEAKNAKKSEEMVFVNATKRNDKARNYQISFTIFSGWEKYYDLHSSDECVISFDENNKRYQLFSPTGKLLESFNPVFITRLFGAHREFIANYEDTNLHFQNNREHHAVMYFRITDRY